MRAQRGAPGIYMVSGTDIKYIAGEKLARSEP